MLRKTVIRIFVLLCIVVSTGCNGALPEEGGSLGTTEIDLVITDPDNPEAELTALIDFVSYQITCADSGLLPQGYNDAIALYGNFEVDLSAGTPVWELVTDLPPAPCTIALWVFYEDEVICSGFESLPLIANGNPSTDNKFNIVLECNLSVEGPSADVDIDGSFTFINGNYCPKLNWFGAIPLTAFDFTVETISFDPDSTCGQNCDPQTCDFTQNPPVCTPGPNPGFSNMLSAPAENGNFGTPDAMGNPINFQTTYTCDPLVPGPTELCVLATDGDNDCDQMRCITVECPDLCDGVSCDDGNECTRDTCDPTTGVCSNDPAPDGIACNACDGTCVGGTCSGPAYSAANNSDLMFFQGTLQPVNTTFVNPYSGQSLTINTGTANLNVNISSYKGIGTSDVLSGTNQGDVLIANDPFGTQTICGVETVLGFQGFDLLMLADDFVVLQGMTLEGGVTNDVIWANAGDDTLLGNEGVDRLDGGPGNDIMQGGNGGDLFTLWPGCGFDSITGGLVGGAPDRVEILAFQSQVLITPAADPSYEFDLYHLGVPLAQIREIQEVVMNDATIDLATCTGPATDVCNLCGNDALNGVEECDDGNNDDGDGCAADCTAEY
jgi:cysteine-rich repeat protein